MGIYLAGLCLFFGAHSVSIVAPAWRERRIAQLGERRWKGIYSGFAGAGLALIIVGYGHLRREPTLLYVAPGWMHWATLALMIPVFPLLLATYLPGRISSAVKNPTLVSVALWGLAHLLSNGTLADVLLFGSFLAWALADLLSLRWRPAHSIRTAPPAARNDLVAIVAGVAIYIALIAGAHRWLFGVSPLA